MAGSIVPSSGPDPLLDGGPTAACAARVDYAAGGDVNGNPVVPADTGAGRMPVPDSIAIPIGRNRDTANMPAQGPRQGRRSGPSVNPTGSDNASNRDSSYIALDGRKLEPLLNPPPCFSVH